MLVRNLRRANFTFALILLLLVVSGLSGAADDRKCGETDGHFRGRFWSFYERGLSWADCEMWDQAEADFREAIKQREADQVMAKTYGLNFIDYFPHRELGIALYRQGKIDEARAELKTSYGQEPTERAASFLNQLRRELLQKSGGETTPPEITLSSPADGTITAEFKITVSGTVRDAGGVVAVQVNGVPAHFDLALDERRFAVEVPVPSDGAIAVTAEDLMGNLNNARASLKVDREGPQVVIEEIKTLKPGRFLIRGVAVDQNGVARVKLGSREIKGSGADVRFEEEVEAALGIFLFEAEDVGGNRTHGAMSEFKLPAKGAFAPRRRLYAALGLPALRTLPALEPTFVAAAVTGPSIEVKSVQAKQTVYVDRLVVEGVARSASSVTQLSVQNRSILVRPGQQVYFSAITPLAAGNNTIKVAATDSDRQKTESSVTVTRQTPVVHQVKSRYSIAVMPFGGAKPGAAAQIAYSKFLNYLSQLDRFDLLEREKLDLILAELEISQSGLVDPSTSVQAGKMMAASGMMLGQINARGNAIELVVRLVDTETGVIILSRDAYAEQSDLKAIDGMCERLAWKIRQAFPLVEGNVVKVSGKTIYTDLPASTGIARNMQLIVFKLGEEIRGPNGQLLGAETEERGTAVLVSVEEKFSKADMKPGKGGAIAPGMKVITR